MSTESLLTIGAIVAGPVIAVVLSLLISKYNADKKQRRDSQFQILTTIVMMQWKPVSEENVKALNLIDLYFHDAPKVRSKWASLYDAFHRRDLSADEASRIWRNKQLELIHEMACHLGFKETLKQLDFDRVYVPQGIVAELAADPKLIDELIGLLEETKKDAGQKKRKESLKVTGNENTSNS